jgi:hypothetical protein
LENISYIAWWGAGLSTLLALIKLWELWRTRFRIEVGRALNGSVEMGNDIHIRNLSSNPTILCYWELFYRDHLWPFRKDTYIISPEADSCDIRIEQHSSKTFNFNGQDHFSWDRKVMKGRRIYIRLHFAGRWSIIRKIYG